MIWGFDMSQIQENMDILSIMIRELRAGINQWCGDQGNYCGLDARMQSVESVFEKLQIDVKSIKAKPDGYISFEGAEMGETAIVNGQSYHILNPSIFAPGESIFYEIDHEAKTVKLIENHED